MKWKSTNIFIFLCVLFLVYTISIYLKPINDSKRIKFNKEKAADGQLVWQKYNCQSCHQLYGLGGFLGPDLTNIISEKGKGELIVKAFVKSGVKQMPAFDISDKELDMLIEFLKSADASGNANPANFDVDNYGMIYEKKVK